MKIKVQENANEAEKGILRLSSEMEEVASFVRNFKEQAVKHALSSLTDNIKEQLSEELNDFFERKVK